MQTPPVITVKTGEARIHSNDPAVEKALQQIFDGMKARAEKDGWSPSQADWIARFAEQTMLARMGEGLSKEELVDQAYAEGRKLLAEAYFNNALDEGKNRITAFLTVVDLERQVRERAGEGGKPYPEAWLKEACAVVEAAAAQGASTSEQIAAGFASIQASAQKAATGQ